MGLHTHAAAREQADDRGDGPRSEDHLGLLGVEGHVGDGAHLRGYCGGMRGGGERAVRGRCEGGALSEERRRGGGVGGGGWGGRVGRGGRDANNAATALT